MPRQINRLNTKTVASLMKPGRHADGGGLYLFIQEERANRSLAANSANSANWEPSAVLFSESTAANPANFANPTILRRRWVYRFSWEGRVREMGLGSASTVGVVRARELAERARRMVQDGIDPIAAREERPGSVSRKPTFGAIADAYIQTQEPHWRSAKHREQVRQLLTKHAAPLRDLPVDTIDTEAVLSVLKPAWLRTPETASRLRGQIEAVLSAAKAAGHRSGENPAQWRGHLEHLLGKRAKTQKKHHAAMDYHDIPAFVAELRKRESMAALCLELCILTAARAGEVKGARWSEIDLSAGLWVIPASRMKAGKEHRIPLSAACVRLLTRLSASRVSELVFPGQRPGRPLNVNAMRDVLISMGRSDATTHGMRSAFRDWCGNETHTPREIAEHALAHATGNSTELAYRRSDALEKRRALMNAWSDYIEQSREAANVVPLPRSAGASAG